MSFVLNKNIAREPRVCQYISKHKYIFVKRWFQTGINSRLLWWNTALRRVYPTVRKNIPVVRHYHYLNNIYLLFQQHSVAVLFKWQRSSLERRLCTVHLSASSRFHSSRHVPTTITINPSFSVERRLFSGKWLTMSKTWSWASLLKIHSQRYILISNPSFLFLELS